MLAWGESTYMRGKARVEQQGFENEWEVHMYIWSLQ